MSQEETISLDDELPNSKSLGDSVSVYLGVKSLKSMCLKRTPGRWFFWLGQVPGQCFPGFSDDNEPRSACLKKPNNRLWVFIFILKTPVDSSESVCFLTNFSACFQGPQISCFFLLRRCCFPVSFTGFFPTPWPLNVDRAPLPSVWSSSLSKPPSLVISSKSCGFSTRPPSYSSGSDVAWHLRLSIYLIICLVSPLDLDLCPRIFSQASERRPLWLEHARVGGQ